jgi:N utilization substance protein B
MALPLSDEFPVSRNRTVRGTRHLAREKVLQILIATIDNADSWDLVVKHIFDRQFTFDAEENADESGRILRADEVFELEADVPIQWSEEDRDYAQTVITAARTREAECRELIDKHAKNWEIERIALIDRMLMHMAIAEVLTCPDIPVKVTINEVIELAKRYSTDKSGTFINGILDAVVSDLTAHGNIAKTGRGLVE